MKIYVRLIRHAESISNTNPDIIGGRNSSVDLSNTGMIQSKSLGLNIRKHGINFDRIICSTAVRARETLKQSGIKCSSKVKYIEQLEELTQGEAEGKRRHEWYTPERLKLISKDPYNYKNPGGESEYDVALRISGVLSHELSKIRKIKQDEYHLGVFTHGYCIKSYISFIMEWNKALTYYVNIGNCSLTSLMLDTDNNIWRLMNLNQNMIVV